MADVSDEAKAGAVDVVRLRAALEAWAPTNYFSKPQTQQQRWQSVVIDAAREYMRRNEQQRRNFAYGNATLDNPAVTRELVDEAADELAREDRATYIDQAREHLSGLSDALEMIAAGDAEPAPPRDHFRDAVDAIDLFVEYRDKHGYTEERARGQAALDMGDPDAEPASGDAAGGGLSEADVTRLQEITLAASRPLGAETAAYLGGLSERIRRALARRAPERPSGDTP